MDLDRSEMCRTRSTPAIPTSSPLGMTPLHSSPKSSPVIPLRMPLYQIADLVIDSSIALRCVPLARARVGAWKFVIEPHSARPLSPAWYHHEAQMQGARWRTLGRAEDNHVICFWRQASFTLSFNAQRISCYPRESASLETVRQLFIGHVIPLVFAEQGALPLHASVVHTSPGALAFVGQTGSVSRRWRRPSGRAAARSLPTTARLWMLRMVVACGRSTLVFDCDPKLSGSFSEARGS